MKHITVRPLTRRRRYSQASQVTAASNRTGQTCADVNRVLCGRLESNKFTLKWRCRFSEGAVLLNASTFDHHFEPFDILISRWGFEGHTEASRGNLANTEASWRYGE